MSQPDVINFENPTQPYRRPKLTPWEASLKRMGRAQAIAWHRMPIKERMAILAEVDREQKGETQ